MKRILVVATSVVALVLGVTTSAHAEGPDARSIIMARTGADAVQVTTTQTLGDFSVGTGRSKGRALDSFIQRSSDSVSMLSTITNNSQSTVTYAFGVPEGAEVKAMPDGGLVVLRELVGPGRTVEVLGTISAPWAVDANGVSQRTAYTYANGVLSQSVDTTDAAFPVVADPTITFGWGVYLNMYGYELNSIATALIAVIGGAYAWTCAFTAKLPTIIAKLVIALCTVVGAPSVLQIFKELVNFWRYHYIYNNSCYQKQIVPNTGTYTIVTAYRNCYW